MPGMSNLLRSLKARPQRGFTLVELLAVITILSVLVAIALPKFSDMGSAARTASIRALAGSVTTAIGVVRSVITIRGAGAASTINGITLLNLDGGRPVRVWNGYPDRWCDGVGITLQGLSVPNGGCYPSIAPIKVDGYTFYGYGNSTLPDGDAGWRIEEAPTPILCSVQYTYNGSVAPVVKANTTGC